MAHHSVSDLDSHRAPFGYARALGDYVMASPSSYHAVAAAAELLRGAGFTELSESEAWSDVGGRHFTIRDGALIAWVAPRDYRAGAGARILGAHTDSPGFKLKPKPTTVSNGWYQAGVEVYGGVLLNSWLDRDLRLAGRIVVRGENGELTQHLCATEAVARIPQLAIHLDRGANEGLKLDKQQHVQPIWGTGSAQDADVLGLLADMAEASVAPEDIVGFDVVLADTQKPELIGQRRQLLASGRLDNLSSVYAGMHALVEHAEDLESASQMSVLAAFDHEEVGSATRSGAAGPFLEDVLARISAAQGESQDDYRRSLSESVCLSADAGHLVHPNYRGHHDPVNTPEPGAGPLLKINANQRYTTDAVGAGLWADACERAGVSYQEFVSNNNVPCGSTIGPITATRLGMRTLDVGVGLLSMHSARELAHVDDLHALSRVTGAFWRS
ncbi:M18 family aminopeptidase [Kocuria sp. WRN011]|uniref:M18 family aminopeptidase n=1 Tax=Kocuria TaxID=57493 RepID=UPI000BAF1F7C|nr:MULTISPECIES: M18 family aminopeptidase [Kocuria]PBB08352.1 M18 family aminopeptidase [Kocuria sp. WRN011]PZP24569.1 MAG: M18 family aminopeptidase [Kocuria rhizophila]